MLIQDIQRGDSLKLLAHLRLGRLACAQGAQPYIVPIHFAYAHNYLYSFSTIGRKIDWMRANPLVCVETDEVISPQNWLSLVILGRYEELPDTPDWGKEREFAHQLLEQKAVWWEPGYAKTIVSGVERPLIPIYFRIEIIEITGRQGIPDPGRGIDVKNLAGEQSREGARKDLLHAVIDAIRSKLHST